MTDLIGDPAPQIKLENFLYDFSGTNISIVKKRSLVEHFPSKSVYGHNETLEFHFNVGDDYVNKNNSYLRFRVNPTYSASAPTSASIGSVYRFIKDSTFTSNGQEALKAEEYGLYQDYNKRYDNNRDYFHTHGYLEAFPTIDSATRLEYSERDIKTSTDHYFQIPLKDLNPAFNSTGNVMLPPHLMSGSKLQVTFNAPSTVFKTNDAANTVDSYTIDDVGIYLDSSTLMDRYHAFINKVAATKKLEYSFIGYHHDFRELASATANIQVNRQLGIVQRVSTVSRLAANVTSVIADSFGSLTLTDIVSYQMRHGSQNYPATAITRPQDLYKNTLSCFKVGSVSYEQAVLDKAMMSTNFQQSPSLLLSGVKVSNSQVAEVRISYPDATNKRINTFVDYVKLVRLGMNNIEMKI